MSLIDVQNLTFAYDGSYDTIFDNVSFQIDTDWKLGLTGRNGRGKTTLLHLLMGRYACKGRIIAPVDFAYFPYDVPDGSISAEAVIAGVCGGYAPWMLQRELTQLAVAEEALRRSFDTLSKGEQTKVLLAALFLKENRFLLIDEPTNHLDEKGRAVVSRYLQSKGGFILVSHDRAFVDGCVDHILSINRSGVEIQQGDLSSYLLNKARRDSFELGENEKLRREIQRLEASAREKASWSDRAERTQFATKNAGLKPDRGHVGHKAAKMMKRGKTMEKRQADVIEKKALLLKDLEKAEQLKLVQPEYHAKRLVSLSDVSIAYGDRCVCRGVTFSIERGDRVVLSGKNGSGKSSILKLVLGEDVPYAGDLLVGSRLSVSYVPQDTDFLRGSLTEFARQSGIDQSLFQTILRKLDFERVQFEKDMADFSQGQRKKVLIARSLCQRAHLLVWDEPLNYIDVLSRMQIERLLLDVRPTILFAEHDRLFCEAIATKAVRL